MTIKGVIFDLDGTLLDSIHDIAESVNHVLEKNGLKQHTLQEFRTYIGNGVDKLISRSLEGNTNPELFEKIKKEYSAYYSAHSEVHTKPFDGIEDSLRSLRNDGYSLAILSNKGDADVKKLAIKYFGDTFAQAHGQFGPYKVKPSPDLAILTANELGLKPEEILFVGDSPEDVMTAHNAGMKAVAVLWGYRSLSRLQDAGCEYVCASPSDLYETIRKACTL